MKNRLKVLITTTMSISILACSSPKQDAEKVCDCYQTAIKHLKANPNDQTYSLQKCMALDADLQLKYKGKVQELMEYHIQLDSCTKTKIKGE